MNTNLNQPGNREDLIAALTEDLTPVRRVNPVEGGLLIATATLIAFGVSVFFYQFWTGLVTGEASGYFWITHGLLLVLGVSSTSALVASSRPRVGMRANAPIWSAGMLAVVPVAAVIGLFSFGANHSHEGLNDPAAIVCTQASLLAGLLVAATAVVWLRRGAPVSIERSAWLTGLAAGSLGTLAYGITCPVDSLSHVGLWHVAPVAIAAVLGRFVVPPLIRW